MMKRASLIACVVTAALLGGCTAQNQDRPAKQPLPVAGSDRCGASRVVTYIGQPRSDALIAQIKVASGAQTVRVLGPNDAMTMDFREDRLTITTDAQGLIETLRCV